MIADFSHYDIIRWVALVIEFFCFGVVVAAHREFVKAHRWSSTLVATGMLLFVVGSTIVIWSRLGHHDIVLWYTPMFAVAAALSAVGFLQIATRALRRRMQTTRKEPH